MSCVVHESSHLNFFCNVELGGKTTVPASNVVSALVTKTTTMVQHKFEFEKLVQIVDLLLRAPLNLNSLTAEYYFSVILWQ